MPAPEVAVVGGAVEDRHYAVTNLPEPDGGAFAPSVERSLGGVGANVAVGLARLGRETGLVSRVGDDDRGRRVLDRLGATPVNARHVAVAEDETSTHSMILRDPGGERMIVTAGESYRNLAVGDDALRYLAGVDAVFLTAYTPDEAVRTVLNRAAEGDFPPVAFDLSGPVEELADRGTRRETIRRALERCRLFVTGEVAAEAFFDGGAQAAAQRLSAAPVPTAAVTHGADDAFNAALVDRWLLADEPPGEAGRFAAAAAALNCRTAFTQPGLPTAEEVAAFRRGRSG